MRSHAPTGRPPKLCTASWALGASFVLGACGGASHSQVVDAMARGELQRARALHASSDGDEGGALREVAAAVLRRHAVGADDVAARAAFGKLAGAGTRAVEVLEDVVFSDAPQVAKTRALSRLAQLGDAAAAGTLRVLALDSVRAAGGPAGADAELLAMALPYLDLQLPLLNGPQAGSSVGSAGELSALALLEHPAPAVRAATVAGLTRAGGGLPMPIVLRARLLEVLRLDPAPAVRAAAVTGIARHAAALDAQRAESDAPGGHPSSARLWQALAGAVDDPAGPVELAALHALADLCAPHAPGHSPCPARPALRQQVAGDVGPGPIEAARAILAAADLDPDQALRELASGLLARALRDGKPEHRAQAAVARRSLPAMHRDIAGLRAALTAETDQDTRLALARALGAEDTAGGAALQSLAAGSGGRAVGAAITLAEAGTGGALEGLAALCEATPPSKAAGASGELTQRARAVAALVRLQPNGASAWLFDDAVELRLAAAGALLSLDP